MLELRLEKEGPVILAYLPSIKGDTFWDVVAACKSVEGAVFDKAEKAWVFPCTWKVCLSIRKKIAKPFDMKIVFGQEMWEWSHAEKQRQASIPHWQSQELQDLPWIRDNRPDMWKALASRPFQTVGVKFGMMTRQYIEADFPGLGKTLQTLAVLEESRQTGVVLIVANTSAQQITWPKEIERWTEDEYLVFDKSIPPAHRDDAILELFEECEADPTKRIYVLMNPFWVRYRAEIDEYGKYVRDASGKHKIISCETPEIFRHEWAAVIADESHETLACKTGNRKKWSQQRQGMDAIPIQENGFRISISGTPMRGRPEMMFGQLQWLYPDVYTSFWNWAEEHFEVSDSGYKGAMEIGKLKDPAAFYKELEPLMIRRDKQMVAKDLPPKQYGGAPFNPKVEDSVIGVWLPLLPKQRKFYDGFVNSQEFTDDEGRKLDAIGILAIYTRLKQLSGMCARVETVQEKIPELDSDGEKIKMPNGRFRYLKNPLTDEYLYQDKDVLIPELPSNKFEWIKEFLMERDLLGPKATGKQKVILASQYRTTVEVMRKELGELGTPSFAITGATPTAERIASQDEFQNNPDSPKLFFLQSHAGGTSLTLDQADDVIIIDEYWNPDVQEQIEDRAHRLSRVDHNVTIWYLRSLDTIEEYIGTTVDERRTNTLAVLDGARGVDFRKKLLGK